MKPRYIRRFLLFVITFILGVSAGAVFQKTIGIGNILRAIGIPYPTSAPPAGSTVLPVVEIPSAIGKIVPVHISRTVQYGWMRSHPRRMRKLIRASICLVMIINGESPVNRLTARTIKWMKFPWIGLHSLDLHWLLV